jgi:hypothetical protein
VIVHAEPGSLIYAGLQPGVTRARPWNRPTSPPAPSIPW